MDSNPWLQMGILLAGYEPKRYQPPKTMALHNKIVSRMPPVEGSIRRLKYPRDTPMSRFQSDTIYSKLRKLR